MKRVKVRAADGAELDALVEVSNGDIVVHSRSGSGSTARNPDYRPALEAILTRLTARALKPEVYLDSRPVQHLPLAQRRIATPAELSGPISEQFNYLVRAMNKGSSSHGAWRRIVLRVPGTKDEELIGIIARSTPRVIVKLKERLPNSEQRKVTSEHVHAAVKRLLAGEDAPNFAESRDYDLITRDGERLAPKKVFGLALEEALHIEAFPAHFSAGWSQPSFQILQDAGYAIVKKGSLKPPTKQEVENALAELPPDPEERTWAEGDIRIINHLKFERLRNPKAAQAKRRAIRIANDGRLACEHCEVDWYSVYQPELAEGIFDIHHTVPVAQMTKDHETALEDLLCLCANCHRAEHRRMVLG
ncbi:MAG: HNH endonuclease [Pseudomonadota bacterium]